MVSKASLETLARTMSIGFLAIVVIAVGKEQVQPAAALTVTEPVQVSIAKLETIPLEEANAKTRTVKASRHKAPSQVKARGVWLKSLLKEVGFEGKALKTAWAVAMKGSTGRPKAYNGNRATGDHSYGIFQINMIGYLGADRRELFGISSNNKLFDPLTNAEAAYYMSAHGTDWTSWDIDKSGYNGGVSAKSYQYWLTQYPKG